MNPELGFEEFETSKYIKSILDKIGVGYKGFAETGVVATIKGNGEGKRIMIRADIDALPIVEENDVPYKSQIEGKMHACGHDAHIAGLLGVTELINNHKDDFKGTVDLLFQPAEEGPGSGGAVPMIKAGAIGDPNNPHIDAAISLHVGNFLDGGGQIGVKDGPFTGSSDEIYIKVIGESCHASAPHEGVDPVHIAAQITTSIQGWLTRFIDPVEPVVFTVGKIDGGTRYNIVSDTAQMDCTLRTLNEEVRGKIKEALPKFCDGIAKAHGGSAEVKIIKGYGVGVNAKEINDHIRKTYTELFDADNLIEQEKPVLGAEDFFEFSLRGKIPVAMFWMSTTNKDKGFIAPNHSSTFDIDEEVLYMGAATLAGSAISYLNSH